LLTNNFELEAQAIIEIYKHRWQIEVLFKQLKQNFPLKYFFGESVNAIQTQIWVTLIANLLVTLLQKSLKRDWSASPTR
jgi:IS4 transposase